MIFYIHKNSNSHIPVNSVQYISYEEQKKRLLYDLA